MNILKWIAVIAIAFSTGYFLRSPEPVVEPQVIADCLRLDAFKEVQSALLQDQERVKRLEKTNPISNAQSSTVEQHAKVAEQGAPVHLPQGSNEHANAGAAPAAETTPAQTATATETNISNEEIDQLLPFPMNELLKKNSGPVREKYKEFAESDRQDEWDINTQNRITDFLMSHSYSKFIELQFVKCKINLCEIRGRELKPQVSFLIFAEMKLQDWWDLGNDQMTNGGANSEFYVLLLRNNI